MHCLSRPLPLRLQARDWYWLVVHSVHCGGGGRAGGGGEALRARQPRGAEVRETAGGLTLRHDFPPLTELRKEPPVLAPGKATPQQEEHAVLEPEVHVLQGQ